MIGAGQLFKLAVVLGSLATVNAHPKFGSARPRMIEIRQAESSTSMEPAAASATASATAAAASSSSSASASSSAPGGSSSGNLTDVDILQLYVLTPPPKKGTALAMSI